MKRLVKIELNINIIIELDSKKLQVGDKTYYVDMKRNQLGKFMKLVEVININVNKKIFRD